MLFSSASAAKLEKLPTVLVGKAYSWSEARNLCHDYGSDWDLPSLNDIQRQKIDFPNLNKIFFRNLHLEDFSFYHLIWTKSNQDELNQQFIDVSQALKYDPETREIDAYLMSSLHTLQLADFFSMLVFNQSEMTRAEIDHEYLLAFLEHYHTTELGVRYPIDQDVPLSEQPEYLNILPKTILPLQIIQILSKPSARYVEVTMFNVENELKTIMEGLEVLCVQNTFN